MHYVKCIHVLLEIFMCCKKWNVGIYTFLVLKIKFEHFTTFFSNKYLWFQHRLLVSSMYHVRDQVNAALVIVNSMIIIITTSFQYDYQCRHLDEQTCHLLWLGCPDLATCKIKVTFMMCTHVIPLGILCEDTLQWRPLNRDDPIFATCAHAVLQY